MNKLEIKRRFKKSIPTYNEHAFMQKKICEELISLVRSQNISYKNILEIGCGTGLLTEKIMACFNPKNLTVNDLVSNMDTCIQKIVSKYPRVKYSFLPGDAEKIQFPKNQDLIVSSSTLHWFDNLDVFLEKIYHSLNSNGIFAFTSYGPQNFIEIKKTLNIGLKYLSFNEVKKKLTRHFTIMATREKIVKLDFSYPIEVLKHFKATGTNSLSNGSWTKSNLQHFSSKYIHYFKNENKVPLSYHPLFFITKKLSVN